MATEVLLDTNILAYALDPDHAKHGETKAALTVLTQSDHLFGFVPQVAYELRHVLTRDKDRGGFGLNAAEAAGRLDQLQRLFRLRFPDPKIEYEIFCDLALELEPKGKNVHDIRLVASSRTLGIRKFLTFDTSDFKRAAAAGHIDLLVPGEIIQPKQ